jgi:hypothetical protein
MKSNFALRGGRIAPEIERGRLPVIEAARSFRFQLGRKTPRAFFWVEWNPLGGEPIPADAVLVMAEPAAVAGRGGKR